MCISLDLLQSTVRTGVLWYIPAGHQRPYELPDFEHAVNESCHPLTVSLNLLMDNSIKLSWPRWVPWSQWFNIRM
ncbi:hypothetical protein A2U01_0037050 [Trifolium medium]|uniref:Uncharacterized protein n=1 Tax=Trifolium medium TaxID=97028 RepID=A0A392PWT0_9FABA|nr:hypothetical protein [Trifolium medium]